jgi:hypothetical protein
VGFQCLHWHSVKRRTLLKTKARVVSLTVRFVGYYTSHFSVSTNGKIETFHTVLLLVEIEGHFTHEFVNSVYETRISGYLKGQSHKVFSPWFFR